MIDKTRTIDARGGDLVARATDHTGLGAQLHTRRKVGRNGPSGDGNFSRPNFDD